MDSLLLAGSTLLFAVNFALVFTRVTRGHFQVTTHGLVIMATAFAVQCGFLWQRGQWNGRCPITSAGEVLVFVSWAMVLWYFLLGSTYRMSLLGVLTSGLAALLQGLALLPGMIPPPSPGPRPKVNPWIELHGSLSLLAYGAFGVAALAGVLFICHDRQLKKRPPPRVFLHLPPITHLFRAMMLVLTLGCVLLVAGMSAGYFTPASPSGSKHIVSYLVLGVYAVVIAMRWRGASHRRVAAGAAGGFVVAVLSLWVFSR
jgi:ABC-type uncharacterized transport system permease subunit